MALHAIITAGGRLPRELEPHSESRVKALLRVGDSTLLASAIAALRSGRLASEPLVDDIAVVGSAEVRAQISPDEAHVEEGQNLVDNILRGFLHLGAEQHDYLVLSPDMPFVSGAALADFVSLARESCELGAPLVSREDFLAHFPNAPNRFERVDGRQITMGSAIYLSGGMLKSNIPLMQDFVRLRKHPHRLAALLGLPLILGFISGRLRLESVERRLAQLMGGRVRGLFVSDAGIAYDIDDLQNYDYAMQRLTAQDAGRL
jgi:hypothetical protein